MQKFIDYLLVCFLLLSVCIVSCKKEYSYEGGSLASIAKGTLQDSSGNCQNIQINGNYIKDSMLDSNNYVKVFANITRPGNYVIATDTVNGYWFRDTGTVSHTGVQTFILKGSGKPLSTTATVFTVSFDSSYCNFTTPINRAVFTFDAPPGNCPNIIVNGRYTVNEALSFADSVNVPVTVSVPGTYTIQTQMINGMSFSAKGIFSGVGNYLIALAGSGTPYATGSSTIPILIASQLCTFNISVGSQIIDTSMNWKFTAEGITYSGYIDSLYPQIGTLTGHLSDTIYSMGFFGIFPDSIVATNSVTFQFDLGRINHNITTGFYHPANVADFKDFYGDIYYFSSITGISYIASSSLPAFTVDLDTYDLVTRLVHGTFSGPVLNASGQTVNVTNGEFKAYLGH